MTWNQEENKSQKPFKFYIFYYKIKIYFSLQWPSLVNASWGSCPAVCVTGSLLGV